MITGGFGDPDNTQTGGMSILDDYLYVGTRNTVTGAQILRTADGEDWEAVVEDGFGDMNNNKIEMVFPYAGKLYAGTASPTGCEIRQLPGWADLDAGQPGWLGRQQYKWRPMEQLCGNL